ncbi:MAG: hypothetical protein ABR608_02475, partial [Pseudonocardiaceae bacterium]
CVATAFTLYGGILDEIEAADYDIVSHRVVVPGRRRLAVALPGLSRALTARVVHTDQAAVERERRHPDHRP